MWPLVKIWCRTSKFDFIDAHTESHLCLVVVVINPLIFYPYFRMSEWNRASGLPSALWVGLSPLASTVHLTWPKAGSRPKVCQKSRTAPRGLAKTSSTGELCKQSQSFTNRKGTALLCILDYHTVSERKWMTWKLCLCSWKLNKTHMNLNWI